MKHKYPAAFFRNDMNSYDILIESLKTMGKNSVVNGEQSFSSVKDGSPKKSYIKEDVYDEFDSTSDFDVSAYDKEKSNADIILQECSIWLLKDQLQLFNCRIVSEKKTSDGSVNLLIRVDP